MENSREGHLGYDPSSPTTLLFIRAIGAVSLAVTQEVFWDTASSVVTVLVAAVG